MDLSLLGLLSALLGAAVGAAASIATTVIAARNSARLHQEADKLERLERARGFQRSTLIELQEALVAHMRLVGRAHMQDVKSFDQSKPAFLSEDLDQELLGSNHRLVILSERVADDELRQRLKGIRQDMFNVLMSPSAEESRRTLALASRNFDEFMSLLGDALRSNY